MADPLLARGEDRASIALWVHASMLRAAIGSTLVFAVFCVLHVAQGTDGPVLAIDAACVAWSAFASWLLARRPPDLEESESIGFSLCGFITLNSTITAWVASDVRELFYVSLLPLGLGALTVRRGPSAAIALGVTIAAVVISWRIGVATGDDRAVSWIVMTMLSSGVLAGAIHVGRRRSFQSIVDLQRAERQRVIRERELADQLRHVQKLDAIGTLAGGIAHDINNVLAAILGVAELGMEDARPESELGKEFHEIMTAAERGAELTRNLLGFARRGKHRHAPVWMAHVIDEVVALLGRTAPRQIRLERADDPEAARLAVLGDATQLGQVVMNLCLNSIDATPGAGTITLAVRTAMLAEHERAMLPAGRYVVVEVRDTGAGMSAETLEHAFEPFYSTKVTTSQRSGSGLGLAMVYGTVRDHLGDVSLASEVGVGTTATIFLPAATDPQTAAADGPSREARRAGVTKIPESMTGRPVLVIDDEEGVRGVCTRMLRAHDVATREAPSGRAGVDALLADPGGYSLVLLDLAMPGMTGAECFRELRELDPALPIVLMSGFPKDQAVEELLATGRATFLSKPFLRSALLAALAQVMR